MDIEARVVEAHPIMSVDLSSEDAVERVMVPVPEELRDQVERYVMMLDMRLRTTQMPLDEGAFMTFLDGLNDACRDVLSVGAAAAMEDNDLSIRELAEVLHRPVYETFGIAQELSLLTARAVGPKVNIVGGADEPSGSLDMDAGRLVVARDVAAIVVERDKLGMR
jgi:hypothetical protein